MDGVSQKFMGGLAIALLLTGTMTACQQSPDPAESSAVTSEAPAETAESDQAENGAATTEETTEPAPETATPAESTTAQAVAPEPEPIPPLPTECSNAETQDVMNLCAKAEYEQVDTKLNNAYQSLKASVSAEKADQLITAEEAWLTFRDRYCDFVQSQYAGGSIQPLVYYGCMTQLTQDRTALLEQTAGAAPSYDAADQELNSVYQNLQDVLSAAEQEQLTDAQLAWLDYRDAHCAFEGGDANTCLAQVTSLRTRQLKDQLESRSL